MGLIGGGGSIITVPIFTYLFKMDAVTATTMSLFVVGSTSCVGSLSFIRQKKVEFRTALLFGFPSILGVIFSRRLVVPHLPENIINRWGILMTKDMFLLLLFAVLMLISSYKMITGSTHDLIVREKKPNYTLLMSQGLMVGILTGMIGAGGGFLIVPALVMLLNLDMKKAIATSLFIIAMNSLLGFFSSLDKVIVDWPFLLSFSALAISGIIIGIYLSRNIDGRKLKPAFGWFVLVMGLYIIIKETFLK